MEYRIGEVSKLLGLPVETIRYKDILQIHHNETLDFFVKRIGFKYQVLDEKLCYYQMLDRKISTYKNKLTSLLNNVGCYQFVNTLEYCTFYLSKQRPSETSRSSLRIISLL